MKPIREQFSKGQPGKADPAKGLCAYLVHGLRTKGPVSGLRVAKAWCWEVLGLRDLGFCLLRVYWGGLLLELKPNCEASKDLSFLQVCQGLVLPRLKTV